MSCSVLTGETTIWGWSFFCNNTPTCLYSHDEMTKHFLPTLELSYLIISHVIIIYQQKSCDSSRWYSPFHSFVSEATPPRVWFICSLNNLNQLFEHSYAWSEGIHWYSLTFLQRWTCFHLPFAFYTCSTCGWTPARSLFILAAFFHSLYPLLPSQWFIKSNLKHSGRVLIVSYVRRMQNKSILCNWWGLKFYKILRCLVMYLVLCFAYSVRQFDYV